MKTLKPTIANVIAALSLGIIPLCPFAQTDDCGRVAFANVARIPANTVVPVVLNPSRLPQHPKAREAFNDALTLLSGQIVGITFVQGSKPTTGPYINMAFDYGPHPGTNSAQNEIWPGSGPKKTFVRSDITVYANGTGCLDPDGRNVACFDPSAEDNYYQAMRWIIVHELLHSLQTADSIGEKNVTGGFSGKNNYGNRDMKLDCVLRKVRQHFLPSSCS